MTANFPAYSPVPVPGSPFRDPAVPLAPEQADLRKRVLKEIENDPAAFDMRTWEMSRYVDRKTCTTARCIAGWAQFLARGGVYETGSKALGIPAVNLDAIGLLGLTEAEFGSEDPDGWDAVQRALGGGQGHKCGVLFFMADDIALARLRELAGS